MEAGREIRAERKKYPLEFETVPVLVPFRTIFTPERGSIVASSIILPEISVFTCAKRSDFADMKPNIKNR